MKKVFYVQRLKKFYSEFSQVLERYSVDSGEVYSISDSGNNNDLETELTDFVLKYFGVNPQYKANNSLYFKYLNGNSWCTLTCFTYSSKNVLFITNSGYTVELGADGHVLVDVNDNNNKNILGRDLFLFEIKNGRLNHVRLLFSENQRNPLRGNQSFSQLLCKGTSRRIATMIE